MKKYFMISCGALFFLLIFPFLGFPEIIENIYVSVLAFIGLYSLVLLRNKLSLEYQLDDEETSVQKYVKELKEKIREKKYEGNQTHQKKKTSIKEISREELSSKE